MKQIYYSIRNILFYREPRNNPFTKHEALKMRMNTIDDSKRILTDIMLRGVGLVTVPHRSKTIPKCTYLTPKQRELKNLVEQHGYLVGLL